MENGTRGIDIRSISTAAALRVAGVVVGLVLVLRFFWVARAIFIVAFLGVLLGLAVARAVDHLERWHLRRGVASALVVLLAVGVLVGIGALTAPTILEQTRELSRELPKSVDEIDRWLDRTPAKALLNSTAPGQAQRGGSLTQQLGREMRGATQFLFPILSSIFAALGGAIIVLFIAVYIGATPGLYRQGLLHLVPQRKQERAEEVLNTLRDTLRQWLIARLLAMIAIGVITGLGLMLLGIEGAVALGLLAGLLEFIPFFGPFASAVPAIAIALVESPTKALWVALLYLFVQQLEGNIITPLLLEKRLDIPPVLTVVTVSALGVVFGVLGMLVAEPLLAVVLVTTKMLYVQDVVGDEVRVGRGED